MKFHMDFAICLNLNLWIHKNFACPLHGHEKSKINVVSSFWLWMECLILRVECMVKKRELLLRILRILRILLYYMLYKHYGFKGEVKENFHFLSVNHGTWKPISKIIVHDNHWSCQDLPHIFRPYPLFGSQRNPYSRVRMSWYNACYYSST